MGEGVRRRKRSTSGFTSSEINIGPKILEESHLGRGLRPFFGCKGIVLSANPFELTKEEQETDALRTHGARLLRSVDERFQSIDLMNLDDLESSIREIGQTAASIDALARRFREPNEAFNGGWR